MRHLSHCEIGTGSGLAPHCLPPGGVRNGIDFQCTLCYPHGTKNTDLSKPLFPFSVCVCVSVSPSMQVCIGTVKAKEGTRSPGVRLAGGSELPGIGAGN